jgi:hypothetical protein
MGAPARGHHRKIQLIPTHLEFNLSKQGPTPSLRTRCHQTHRGFSKAVFTEGRKGNEEPGVGSHLISKPALFLPLMEKIQRRFAIFCSKWFG